MLTLTNSNGTATPNTLERLLIQACSEADQYRDDALHWQRKYEQLNKISQRYRHSIEGWQQLAQIVMDDANLLKCQV